MRSKAQDQGLVPGAGQAVRPLDGGSLRLLYHVPFLYETQLAAVDFLAAVRAVIFGAPIDSARARLNSERRLTEQRNRLGMAGP